MAETVARPISTLKLVGIYSGLYVGLAVLALLVTLFLNFENSAMGLIIAFAAASGMAQIWVSRERAAPPFGRAWQVAALCAVVTTAIMAAVATLVLQAEGMVFQDLANEGALMIGVVALGIFALNVLVIRLGLWMTGRSAAKRL